MSLNDCFYNALNTVLSTKREIQEFRELIKQNAMDSSKITASITPALDEFVAISNNLIDILRTSFDHEPRMHKLATLSVDETKQLERLNHEMNNVSRYMLQIANSVRPCMEAKRDDSDDPMSDFEIEAKIDYALREEDPEYREDDDNYLSMRTESLTRCIDGEALNDDWRCSMTPEPFRSEPLSWLLFSLTEHSCGPRGPRVHLKDCLRIGQVYLDIKVWHQYIFDIKEGKWIKRRSEPEWTPEYVNTPD